MGREARNAFVNSLPALGTPGRLAARAAASAIASSSMRSPKTDGTGIRSAEQAGSGIPRGLAPHPAAATPSDPASHLNQERLQRSECRPSRLAKRDAVDERANAIWPVNPRNRDRVRKTRHRSNASWIRRWRNSKWCVSASRLSHRATVWIASAKILRQVLLILNRHPKAVARQQGFRHRLACARTGRRSISDGRTTNSPRTGFP